MSSFMLAAVLAASTVGVSPASQAVLSHPAQEQAAVAAKQNSAPEMTAELKAAARDFRIQTYESFRTDRAEFNRRRAAWDAVYQAWVQAGSRTADEPVLLSWLGQATLHSIPEQFASLPPVPEFGQLASNVPSGEGDHVTIQIPEVLNQPGSADDAQNPWADNQGDSAEAPLYQAPNGADTTITVNPDAKPEAEPFAPQGPVPSGITAELSPGFEAEKQAPSLLKHDEKFVKELGKAAESLPKALSDNPFQSPAEENRAEPTPSEPAPSEPIENPFGESAAVNPATALPTTPEPAIAKQAAVDPGEAPAWKPMPAPADPAAELARAVKAETTDTSKVDQIEIDAAPFDPPTVAPAPVEPAPRPEVAPQGEAAKEPAIDTTEISARAAGYEVGLRSLQSVLLDEQQLNVEELDALVTDLESLKTQRDTLLLYEKLLSAEDKEKLLSTAREPKGEITQLHTQIDAERKRLAGQTGTPSQDHQLQIHRLDDLKQRLNKLSQPE
ncbi:MAG: hypothetical protein SGJ20_22590 [Planctomycetota bacterium]|nr:hypothetical protein [Planctomycetota bacterium]